MKDPSTEILDLNAHDPEEYEGKIVVHNGCEYIVGEYLGSGAERITHKLINRASGLCLHVLKIWRQTDLGYVPSEVRAKLAAARTPEFDFAKVVPVSIEIDLLGGSAEMQIYAGGAKDERTRADNLTDEADQLRKESRLQEAVAAYEQALADNPSHTHALVNLAAARADLNDLAGAYGAAARARSIEPNYPLYRRALIYYLAAQGLARLALVEFQSTQKDFPNVFDFNDLGAELLLVCGRPESAVACAEKCLLDPADKKKLIAKAHAAVTARSKAQALVGEARSLLERTAPLRIVALLEKARAIDPNDPLLAINLAFNLARVARFHEAIPLLLCGVNNGPLQWMKVSYANAAFCAISEGDLSVAMLLLSSTMSQLELELRGAQSKNLAVDLPGKGIWIDEESIIEEPLESAARLVLQSVRTYEKESPVPAEAASLADLYARAIKG